MENQLLYEMKGGAGVILLNTTAESVVPSKGIVIREDTVVDSWEDEDGVDLVERLNISGATLYVSDPPLWVPAGKKSSTLKLTSGSVWQIK